jgi:putative sigma-54 modulation protein
MRIELKGRNVKVPEEVEARIRRAFDVIGKQVSELAVLDVEVRQELSPTVKGRFVVTTELPLKGVTLRARGEGYELKSAVRQAADELEVQVKRHREKRRRRREARTQAAGARTEVLSQAPSESEQAA